jgi:hypothetical protein
MNVGAPLIRREEDLAFFGAVTASLSHQINNVFTIVNELNGLVEDLLFASGDGKPIPPERLKSVAEKIGRNVARGTEYVRLLNRFAHAADRPEAEVDMCELLLLFEAISARFLDLRQAKLALGLPPQALPAKTKPFTLLHLLFVCLQTFLEGEGGPGPISVAARAREGRPVLRMEGKPPRMDGTALESRLDLVRRLAGELEAEALFEAQGPDSWFELVLPA